ncbi:MAG: hypothetical protein WC827_04890 [Candidatus Paceibacterota bacterium]|jgi:hypothetical protein
MKIGKSPITLLVAVESPMVVSGLCDSLSEHDTKHPASDDSDTI